MLSNYIPLIHFRFFVGRKAMFENDFTTGILDFSV